MNKSGLLTATIVLILLVWVLGSKQLNMFVNANPLPSINPKVRIVNPENTTYNVNTVTLFFIAESNWGVYSLFYSLDGQAMMPVEDSVIISQRDINIGKNPRVNRTTLECRCELYKLSEGKHNVTVYQIYQSKTSENYRKGDILSSTNAEFIIDTSSPIDPPTKDKVTPADSPAILFFTIVLITIICTSLPFYFKKRKR